MMRAVIVIAACLAIVSEVVLGQDEWLFLGPGEGSSQPAVISLPLGGETCNLAIDHLPDLLDREGATAALVEGLVTLCNKAKDHLPDLLDREGATAALVEG